MEGTSVWCHCSRPAALAHSLSADILALRTREFGSPYFSWLPTIGPRSSSGFAFLRIAQCPSTHATIDAQWSVLVQHDAALSSSGATPVTLVIAPMHARFSEASTLDTARIGALGRASPPLECNVWLLRSYRNRNWTGQNCVCSDLRRPRSENAAF